MSCTVTDPVLVPAYEKAVASIYRLAAIRFFEWSDESNIEIALKDQAYEGWRIMRLAGAKLAARRCLQLSSAERTELITALPDLPGNPDFDFVWHLKFDEVER